METKKDLFYRSWLLPFAAATFAVAAAGCCGCGNSNEGPRELRLMSYNIYHCQGADRKLDIARTAEVIRRENPDFVGLQEVDSKSKRSNGIDEAEEMGRILGMHATYARTIPFQGGGYGIAMLSKEKPLSVERIPLPGREPRMLLLCEFKDCWFCDTHLALQTTNQLKSVEIIRKAVAARAGTKPVFLVGDWNADPKSKTLAAMREFMTILSKENCRTFHGFKPYKPGSEYCIDYIAVDSAHAQKFAVRDAHIVEDTMTSDHFPVSVTIEERR